MFIMANWDKMNEKYHVTYYAHTNIHTHPPVNPKSLQRDSANQSDNVWDVSVGEH